ncbi:hypothetical protein BH09PSE5_BH09PSE5_37820 [soil metagenome]
MPLLPRARPDLMAQLLPEPMDDRETRHARHTRPESAASSTRRGEPDVGRLYTVALQGFSEFEQTSLASFFRLVSDRTPAYALSASRENSDFIIADVAHLEGDARPASTVYIGSRDSAPAGALGCLPRPIDPVNIVRMLDTGVAALERALEQSAAPEEEFEFDDFEADIDPAIAPPRPVRVHHDNDPFFFEELAEVPIPLALTQLSLPLVHPPTNWDEGRVKDVLVVDDSPIALRFLEMRLRRLGYRVSSARTSAYALELLAEQSFSFVFLDVALGEGDGLDGLQLCRQLKERNRHPGEAAPLVIMVSGHMTPEDRLRAEFAGCDAYLGKPLDERELVNTLGRHDATFGRTLDPGVPVMARRV